jgi:hypothetical protein
VVAGGDSAALVASLPAAVHFPNIVFPAFHPDTVYASYSRSGRKLLLSSPLRDYHSSLILFGFIEGMSQEQTATLFAEPVFRRVGFLDAWTPAQDELCNAARRVGLPLDREFMAWSRRGCFMHTINHPHLETLADLVRVMLKRLGIAVRDAAVAAYVADELMTSVVWPVYPGISRPLGIPGSYVFKQGDKRQTCLDLEGLISACYAHYERFDRQQIECWRMKVWHRNGTREFLRDFAGATPLRVAN